MMVEIKKVVGQVPEGKRSNYTFEGRHVPVHNADEMAIIIISNRYFAIVANQPCLRFKKNNNKEKKKRTANKNPVRRIRKPQPQQINRFLAEPKPSQPVSEQI